MCLFRKTPLTKEEINEEEISMYEEEKEED